MEALVIIRDESSNPTFLLCRKKFLLFCHLKEFVMV